MPSETTPLQLKISATPAATAAGMAALCSFLFHGAELINISINADEEQWMGRAAQEGALRLGRWGQFLLGKLLLPETVFPITSLSVFLFCYGLSFVLLVYLLKIRHHSSVVIASPFFFGFPVLIYNLSYSALAFSIGIGILACTAILYLSQWRSVGSFLACCVLLAFGVSIYQSILWYTLVVFIADIITSCTKPPEDRAGALCFQRSLWYSGVLILGLAFYITIAYLVIHLFAGGRVSYVQSFLHWSDLFQQPASVLKLSSLHIYRLYTGTAPIFLGQSLFYRLVVAALFIGVLSHFIAAPRQRWTVYLSVALILAILVAPFLQYPSAGGNMPYRTLVSLPAALAITALFASEASAEWARRWLALPLSILLILEFSAIDNRQYYAGIWGMERDKLLGSQIVTRIKQVAPGQQTYTIAVIGNTQRYNDAIVPSVATSMLGTSFFQVNGGDSKRVALFLRFVSDANFVGVNLKQWEEAFRAAGNMGSWPAADSIRLLDGFVVIKLSEPNIQQIRNMCWGRQSEFCSRYEANWNPGHKH